MNSVVVVTFSEAVDPATVTAATLTLTGPSGAVTVTRSVEGRVVYLVPAAPLAVGTTYYVYVYGGVTDLAGMRWRARRARTCRRPSVPTRLRRWWWA